MTTPAAQSPLTAPRPTSQWGGTEGGVLVSRFAIPIADNVLIFAGAAVQVAAGYAHPAGDAVDSSGRVSVGRADQTYDNTIPGHAQGAFMVEPREGCFPWDVGGNDDALVQSDWGATVYFIDDHTVGKLSANRSAAGRLVGFLPNGQALVQTAVVL